MKWLAIIGGGIAGLLLVALLVLVLMGQRSGAGRVVASAEVAGEPAEVWPWLREGDRLKQWVSWLTEVHELTPGVEGIGARQRWVMIDPNMNNQRVEIDGEITAWEPHRRSTARLTSPGMFTGTASYVLEPVAPGRTVVRYDSHFRMSSALFRLLEPLVTPQARRKAEDDLARLKAVVESDRSGSGVNAGSVDPQPPSPQSRVSP